MNKSCIGLLLRGRYSSGCLFSRCCSIVARPCNLVVALFVLCAMPAVAQDGQTAKNGQNKFGTAAWGVGDWFAQDTFTGDWGGARTDIENFGVTPAFNYTTDVMGNPTGGLKQSSAYAAGWTGSLTFDLEKIAAIPGLTFFLAGSIQQGTDLSEDTGNIFAPAQIFNGDVARLNQMYLQLSAWDDLLDVTVGRLAAGDDFAALDSYGNYVSGAVNGNPTSILVDFPSFTTPPFAQWGARATVTPAKDFYVSAGVYNADPTVQEDREHGVDFTLNPDKGVLTMGQVGYKPNQNGNGEGLPGHYALLGIYDSSDYSRVDDPDREKSGNYSFALLAEQMIYREGGKGSDQGLSAWATFTVAPDQSINTLPYGIYGGAYYQGLIPKRDNDVTAIALYSGVFSDDLRDQDYELVFELTYRFQVGPWFYLQPDFQYIFHPNGGGIDDAAVFGGEISIDF